MSRGLLVSMWSLLATVFLCANGVQAENWPQWRGPTNNGLSNEKNMPVEWAPDKNIAWKLAMPGQGGSTPCLWGDRLFLTSAEGEDLVVWAVSTEGKKLWDYKLAGGNRKARGDEGNLASPSPSTDGKYVWAMVGTGDLACFDFDGKVIWKTNLQERYGKFSIQFGMSSTPVLDGDRLYLQLIHGDGKPETREAVVLCLDKMTGSEIWKQGRPSEAHSENEHSYASPIMYRDEKQAFFLTHGADYIVAHDLNDGHELWRSGGLHSPARYDPTLRLVASPACVPGLIIVPSAKKGQLLAILPGGKGDITDNKNFKIWTYPTTPDVPSPLIVNDLIFLCRENGNLICLERSNGKELYQKRTHVDRYRASPVYCDGKIYVTSRDGTVSVCKASREFELLATNKLAEDISASPVFANGRIYLRSFQSLWAIGTK